MQDKPLMCALYGRVSSDIQNDTSVDDQWASLERVAPRLNLKPVKRHFYGDRCISGDDTIENKPELSALLRAAERGEFQAVLVEASDRLSRDGSDLLFLKRHFEFNEIRVFHLTGEFSDLQWTFESHGNADFLKKLAIRVKRGHDAKADKETRIMGCLAYGYDHLDENRDANKRGLCMDLSKRGLWKINEFEASVMVRIFTEIVMEISPRKICTGLERDGILSPSGKSIWNWQGIVGGKGAKRGLLHNRLYIGEYVRNRYTAPKHPKSRKRRVRALPAEDMMVKPVPHLRIISDELWNAAHAVVAKRAHQKFGPSGYVKRQMVPRKQGLLSGMMFCGKCFGPMTVVASSKSGQRIGCSGATYRKSCDHTKSYELNRITPKALEETRKLLTDPELLKEKQKAKALEAAKLAREGSDERQKVERQIDKLKIQIKRLVDSFADTGDEITREAITARQAERAALDERLKYLPDGKIIQLTAAKVSSFSRSVDVLLAKLEASPDDPEARLAFQNVIGSVVIQPTPKAADYEIDLYARYSAIENGINLFPAKQTFEETLKKEALTGIGSGGTVSSFPTIPKHTSGLFFLGRFAA